MEKSKSNLDGFITRFLKTWKRQLGLTGWDILWLWGDSPTIDEEAGYTAVAVTHVDLPTFSATIRVSQDKDWQTNSRIHTLYLPEVLLHELLHIRFAAGEDRLDLMKAAVESYTPPANKGLVQHLVVGAREFYVEATLTLLLDLEEAWKSKTSK